MPLAQCQCYSINFLLLWIVWKMRIYLNILKERRNDWNCSHFIYRCIIRWVSEDVRFSVLIVVVQSDYDFIHLDKTMMKLLVCRCRGRCRCRCRWGCSLNTEFRNYRVDNNAKINATTWRLIAIGQFAKSNLVKTTQ